jgi:hypothetical protein
LLKRFHGAIVVVIVVVASALVIIVGPSRSHAKNQGTGYDEETTPLKIHTFHETSSPYLNEPDRSLTGSVKWLSAQLR